MAYEMRISDWSSDVCSSDLPCTARPAGLSMAMTSASIWRMRACKASASASETACTRGSDGRGGGSAPSGGTRTRSEERRVGKASSVRVDVGGRRIIKKTKNEPSKKTKLNIVHIKHYT